MEHTCGCCGGSGKVTCPRCASVLFYLKLQKKNYGKTECKACDGTGTVND